MKQPNLFGEMQEVVGTTKSKYERKRRSMGYRKAYSKVRSCKTCTHLIRKEYSKTYYSCALIGDSKGPATDVRLSFMCNHFERTTPE